MDKKIIARNFSRYANLYDNYCQVQNQAGVDLLSRVKNKRFKNILELGCGTGNFTSFLVEKFPEANIKALDFSKEMLNVARNKVKNENVDFILADAEEIVFKDKFDLITSNASVQWFDDLDAALNKYKGMLARKGAVLFSIFGPGTYEELSYVLKPLAGNENISAANFTSLSKIKRIFKNSFKSFNHEKKIYQDEFISLKGLLKNIKYTGVRGAGLQSNICFTANILKKLEQAYIKRYSKIIATFEVFFCEASL